MKLLFVCMYNEVRSRTAEKIFGKGGHKTLSAGISDDAKVLVDRSMICWADVIFVMEEEQEDNIKRRFADAIGHREIIVLDVPDSYYFMEPELVKILRERVTPHLE